MDPIKLYWSASKPNVGDWLSPRIVQSFTARPVKHSIANKCELMSIGSILHKAKNHWWSPAIDIWGSGFMHDRKPSKLKHRVHAVRGKLTRDRILNASDVAIGDPGLFVSSVFSAYASDKKKFSVGVIPHYCDKEDLALKQFIKRNSEVKFLDIFDGVESFISQLTECQFILSSSLHGLIMADSFGIPNQWMVLSDKVEGKNFKFYDYYSVFDMPAPDFVTLEEFTFCDIEKIAKDYQRPGIAEVKLALKSSFPLSYK